MKKIVVPTDFSSIATNAFIHAVHYAVQFSSEIILVHTYETPVVDLQFYPENLPLVLETYQKEQTDFITNETHKWKQLASEIEGGSTIKIKHVLKQGDLITVLNDVVTQEYADMVIMGTSGAEGWKEALLGTNTGEAITTLVVPVLSVPENAVYTKVDTIGFTTRFRDKDKQALYKTLEIAQKIDAHVKCLYVKTNKDDVSDAKINEWEKEFSKEKVTFFIIPDDDVLSTIDDFVTDQEIDLLLILTYKRSFFASLFSNSFTEKVANHMAIPILALHEE